MHGEAHHAEEPNAGSLVVLESWTRVAPAASMGVFAAALDADLNKPDWLSEAKRAADELSTSSGTKF